MTEEQDHFARVFSLLSSLREYIGSINDYTVEEIYVIEYHSVLDKLEGIGIATSEFRIPSSEVNHRVTCRSLSGDTYSKERYVKRLLLLIKLDATLKYFNITTSKPPKKMGFSQHKDQ